MRHSTTYTLQKHPKRLFLGLVLLFPFLKTNAQVLDNYISEAKNNSPKMETLYRESEIEKEKINEVNSFPNTKFSGSYFLGKPTTLMGTEVAKFSVHQDIPWFGTISARKTYQKTESEMVDIMIRITKRELTLAVSQSYYKLYALKAKQRVTDSIISLLKTYKQLALKAVEVNKASAVDVLQLQIRQNELSEQKLVFQSDYEAERNRFVNLLNRKNQQQDLFIPDSLGLPAKDSTFRRAQRAVSVIGNPELMHFDHMKRAVDDAERVNAKEAKPQLGFGVDYMAMTEQSNMDLHHNGKDMLTPTISVSIPIFTHKYRSISRQNTLEKEKLEAEKTDRKNELQTALAESLQKQKAARITFETQQKNLKQAQNAEQILLKTYETATLDFDDVLDIEALRLKIQLKQIEAVKDYYQHQARIDYLTKAPKPPKGAQK